MSNKYRSFAITIRPPSGLTPESEYEKRILSYIKKAEHWVYAFEMEGEARHIHAQIWFTDPRNINDIRKTFFRIGEENDCDWSFAAKKVTSKGIKIAYNDDFIDYIHKQYTDDDDGYDQFIQANIPPDTSLYYPSKEEQEQVMAKAAINKAADPYFARLKHLWELENPDYVFTFTKTELIDIPHFYFKQMFELKTIPVIRDAKNRKASCKCLYYYIFPVYQTQAMITLNEAEYLDEYNKQ